MTDPSSNVSTDVDVMVVGAGIAGLYTIHRLRGLGFRVRGFEAGPAVGGTWFWNRYPGARVDIESLYYSFSFDPQLEQEWEWTERYPTQPELERYLNHVADRFDLRRSFTFNTRVLAMDWDDIAGRWTVGTDAGDHVTATHCVMATGCLSVPKAVDVPGLERFTGEVYSTSSWPAIEPDLHGKRVGVVGTGSSGVQAIPVLAERAAHLTVFQRTANFSSPARNRPLRPGEQDDVKSRYFEVRHLSRTSRNGLPVILDPPSALETAPEELNRVFEEHWAVGGPTALLSAYNDIMADPKANALAADFIRDKIRATVSDPEVADSLCPKGLPLGTKRMTVDTGYYETFNRTDVTLVDLRKTPFVTVTESGIRTSDQRVERDVELDVLILATGFDAITGALSAIDIRGRDGLLLREKWAAGPRAYLGLLTAQFPNLFLITGPGSPGVLTNMIVSIEQHVDFVADLLTWLEQRDEHRVEPEQQAEDDWVEHVNDAAGLTLMLNGDSWYLGANVPGKARIFMPYVGGVGVYRELCDAVAADDYRGLVAGHPAAVGTGVVGTEVVATGGVA